MSFFLLPKIGCATTSQHVTVLLQVARLLTEGLGCLLSLVARIEALGALGTTQLRHILEGVSVKDVASGELPEYVKKIAEDPAVWT